VTRMDDIRTPLNANDAEQSVLGSLMLAPGSLAQIADWLGEDAFYRQDHRLIYRAICALAAKGEPCDAVTLGEWFQAQRLVSQTGGASYGVSASYVIELANTTPSAANIVAYAEIVAEKARLRGAIDVGTELAGAADRRGADSASIVAAAMQRLTALQTSKLRGGLQATKPLLKAWYAELHRRYEIGERVTGLPTPWRAVNTATHGLQDGELVLIPGRPNMGKSVAGFNLAAFTALRGQRAALFSLEMTAKQVMRRCVAALADVPHDWLTAPHDSPDSEAHWTRITAATEQLSCAPLLIDDSPALTVDQIVARARRAHLQAPLRLVIVDHMHIVRRAGENEVRELGEISRSLKALAKELNCPVVALAQLNRNATVRNEKRPVMTDLRASGEIEQDADLILFLHREDYYNHETHLQGVVEIEIGKGRDVKTGERMHLANRFDVMRLDDWEGSLPEPKKAEDSRTRGFGRQAYPVDGDRE
jgi:replicative DNA helicase